ncbi:phage terminase large subunit [Microvirga sp. CF3062]|uniref:phage terminase large subunit n=1 Tax=Microvirga sp. CF3062 TaxID=3110182 RepID=UPI002E77DBBC|nr:phage terminase large subunit [Microvirga sp. CF3062]MEE1656949.1 phage terminase large subunit [Microvirga sp. CF3062]
MTDRARLLRALLRQDLSTFSQKVFATLEPGTPYRHNWHIDHLCWQLTRVARGEVRRLIINVPPRSMKSITVSVGFTAWVLGRDPTRRIICASYADDLARKLSVDTRTVLDSPWYRELFPQMQLASRRPRNTELVTTQQGYRYAAGMSGSILGRGADLIVIDDPIKATDALSEKERRRVNEAFDNTLYTRLNDKRTGAIVIIMQRLHQDDLVGHVLTNGDWEVVSIPAIETAERAYRLSDDPEDVYIRRPGEVLHAAREPREILEQMRRSQGSLTFSAQYQQAPVPPEGNIVKREWLRTYSQRPSSFDMVIASWDTASTLSETSDYSVGTLWGAKGLDFYLLDLVRGRFEVPELRREVLRLSQTWKTDQTIIEDTDIGRAITQDLRRSGEWRAILRRPRFDKEARFLAQSARFESGQVHVPQDAPWLAGWLDELLAFPNGRHDDQVDSTSQALDYLTARTHPLHASEIPRERPKHVQRPAGFR